MFRVANLRSLLTPSRSASCTYDMGLLNYRQYTINTNRHHPHDNTIIATLPHNANIRYPSHRHTIPNEQHWEENWVKTGLYLSQLTNFSLVQQKAKLNKNR